MNGFKDKKDSALVELSLLGNEKAYEELVIRYEKSVKGTALKVTENEFSAEDASQDAFVSAWIKLDSLREPDKFGSWVCSIAKNCARSLVIHYKNASADISLHLLENKINGDIDNKLLEMLDIAHFAESERNEKLHEAIEALSEKIRTTIKLHYFQGLSVEEISVSQNIPIGTVKWRLNEGRKQLRKEYGVMTKFDDNMTFVQKVMYQVEQLKLWSLKNDKSGFEKEYRKVLSNVEKLEESVDKHHALADVLMRGYWWLPGEKNDATFNRIKESVEKSHNEDVMQSVVSYEMDKYSGQERIDFLLNTKIPHIQKIGFNKTLGYCWFWLGYYYIEAKQFEDGINSYKKVLSILDENDIYYANALSAIEVEEQILNLPDRKLLKIGMCATAESYKFIDGKIYFWQQPGYSRHTTLDCAVFWNCSACDNLMPYEDMVPGEKILSSDKNITMYCKEKNLVVKTDAGAFNDCMCVVWEFDEKLAGNSYCETYFAAGVGIVKQFVIGRDGAHTWELKDYSITGGVGILPFAKGNRWEYTCKVEGINYDVKNNFEVVTTTEDSAILKKYSLNVALGYDEDTWIGNILKARNEYVNSNNDALHDVLDCYMRAKALAKTKREKLYTSIAENVMQRIFETDNDFNPNYTKIGRWNFFNIYNIKNKDEKTVLDSNRVHSFEWKAMRHCGAEGWKALYNQIYSMLNDLAGAIWSDNWVSGYHTKQTLPVYWNESEAELVVLEDENVNIKAGDFKDCRHIRITTHGFSGGMGYWNGIKEWWFAPEVGIVKFTSAYEDGKTNAVWELTEYKGTGCGYFPVEDGLFRKYEPTDIGNGWHAAVEYTFDSDENGTVIFRNALGTQDRNNYEADMAKIEKK